MRDLFMLSNIIMHIHNTVLYKAGCHEWKTCTLKRRKITLSSYYQKFGEKWRNVWKQTDGNNFKNVSFHHLFEISDILSRINVLKRFFSVCSEVGLKKFRSWIEEVWFGKVLYIKKPNVFTSLSSTHTPSRLEFIQVPLRSLPPLSSIITRLPPGQRHHHLAHFLKKSLKWLSYISLVDTNLPHCFGFGAKTFDKITGYWSMGWRAGGSYKATTYVLTVPSFLFAIA